jgi:gamma-glutamyltranspeptidase/glutathione hydrolase
MGGHMQPQGHVQVMLRLFAHGQNPQTACDGPRWYLSEQSELGLEPGVPAGVARELALRGHRLMAQAPTVLFGGAQIIQRVDEVFWGGSDPRKDGQAIGI